MEQAEGTTLQGAEGLAREVDIPNILYFLPELDARAHSPVIEEREFLQKE